MKTKHYRNWSFPIGITHIGRAWLVVMLAAGVASAEPDSARVESEAVPLAPAATTGPAPAEAPRLLERVEAAKCRTAWCFETESAVGKVGLEIFADIPVGGAWFVHGKDRDKIPGLQVARQIRSQFNDAFSLSLQGGARILAWQGMVSLGFGFSAYRTSAFTLERSTGECFTIGGKGLTAAPVVMAGLVGDVIHLSWTRVSYTNDGPTLEFADGERIARGQTLARGHIVTLGIAPVAIFRLAVGLRE